MAPPCPGPHLRPPLGRASEPLVKFPPRGAGAERGWDRPRGVCRGPWRHRASAPEAGVAAPRRCQLGVGVPPGQNACSQIIPGLFEVRNLCKTLPCHTSRPLRGWVAREARVCGGCFPDSGSAKTPSRCLCEAPPEATAAGQWTGVAGAHPPFGCSRLGLCFGSESTWGTVPSSSVGDSEGLRRRQPTPASPRAGA